MGERTREGSRERSRERMGETGHGETDLEALSADEQGIRRLRRRVRLVLDGGSWALFAIFIARLIPTLLETSPTSMEWQAKFVEVLVNDGLLAFLGFVMIHLAVILQPKHFGLRRRLSLVRRLAVLAVLGYMLLVPMLLSSTFTGIVATRSKRTNYIQQSARLGDIRESIQKATSVQDLDLRLQNLFEPALTREQISLGLNDLRRSLLRLNEERQVENTRKLKEISIKYDFFGPLISRAVTALGWAFAFATGAVPLGMHSTLFERLRHH